MKKETEGYVKVFAVIGGIVAIPALLVYEAFSQGFVVYKAWMWFAPVIGIHYRLSFWGAVAALLIVTLRPKTGVYKQMVAGEEVKSRPNWLAIVMSPWVQLLIFWLFTFIVHV